jgi:hypothetical protein
MLRVKLSQKPQPESLSERVDNAVSYIRKHPTVMIPSTVSILCQNPMGISCIPLMNLTVCEIRSVLFGLISRGRTLTPEEEK